MATQQIYQDLINYFGTQQSAAVALDCKQPSVWKWVNGKSFMSIGTAIKAEYATNGKFKAVDLCPALADLENYTTETQPCTQTANT